MPLMKGNSDAIVADNIREMRKAGHPEAQAVAASLRSAGRGKFTSMKNASKKSSNEVTPAKSSHEDYPYGLRLDLNNDSLDKLKMPMPNVGDHVHFHVKGKVESVSANQHAGEKRQQRSVAMQITHMKHVAKPNNLNDGDGDE